MYLSFEPFGIRGQTLLCKLVGVALDLVGWRSLSGRQDAHNNQFYYWSFLFLHLLNSVPDGAFFNLTAETIVTLLMASLSCQLRCEFLLKNETNPTTMYCNFLILQFFQKITMFVSLELPLLSESKLNLPLSVILKNDLSPKLEVCSWLVRTAWWLPFFLYKHVTMGECWFQMEIMF